MTRRDLDVVTIETPSLGDRSYVALADGHAVVIDPQRDIDKPLAVLARTGARATHVLETHIHNDYVTGGLELATRTGAEYGIAAADDVAFARRPLAPGDVLESGPMRLRVVATPGHTPTHLGYVLVMEGRVRAVFSGGSLLYGTVGRTDLIGAELTRELAEAQFRSARDLLTTLPTEAAVYPTHGFGSFCASIAPSEDSGPAPDAPVHTIGAERAGNVVMEFHDPASFAEHLISGLGAYPSYYAHMGPINRAGPPPIDLSPAPPAQAADLVDRVAAGEWVVDLRHRHAYASGHLRGTVAIELGDSFATYLGWLIPWGTPVTLIGSAPEVGAAQRMMARIGIDRPRGAFHGPPPAAGSYPVGRWEDLRARLDEVDVLDVRRREEWDEGHVAGATHVPLHELDERIGEVPAGEVWVHCRTGYRASIACSLLARRHRPGVLVDDEWDRAAAAGMPIES